MPKVQWGFSVPKTPDFDMDCSDLLCFVGWNAQTTMGVFCPQKRNMWKVLVFVSRACQQQWGFSLVEVQVVEKYWFL